MNSSQQHPILSFFAAFSWWVGAVVIFSLFFWTTIPLEQRSTARVVNAAFEAIGDPRRVAQAAPLWGRDGVASLSGTRFFLKKNDETAVVFSVTGAGYSSSFVAVFNPKNGVQAVLPLDADSKTASRHLPAGLLETYIARIAATEAAARRKEGK